MTDTITTPAPDDARARALRHALVQEMRAGHRRRPLRAPAPIEQALLTVPRHVFCPPGTTLEDAYADEIVCTRIDETTGRITSSISAPWLQVRMLDQARIAPGMRVLEVGSGGYNASLIAELVGPAGQVVTVDIDPHVVQTTRAALATSGYDDRVVAVHADAAELLGHGVFDRVIVTVGVWDIAPAWREQLTAGGVLVVPLRARHSWECWSIAFRKDSDLLVGESSVVCGFVDIQGVGARQPQLRRITGPAGGAVTIRCWDGSTDLERLPETLDDESLLIPSGVVLPPPGMFVGLRTRLAFDLPGIIDLTVEEREQLGHDAGSWLPFGHADGESFAVLCAMRADGGQELGARGFGPHAEQVALTLVEHITAWGEGGMPQRAAHAYRPHGSTVALDGTVLPLRHGDLAVTQHHDGVDDI